MAPFCQQNLPKKSQSHNQLDNQKGLKKQRAFALTITIFRLTKYINEDM